MNYRTVGAVESGAMHNALDALLSGRGTFAEIDRLMECRRGETGTAFEQYAGSLFEEARSELLLGRSIRGKLKLIAPGDGQLARIVAAGPLGRDERTAVEATETALNRIVSIVDALDDGIPEEGGAFERERVNISYMGVSHPQSRAGYRSAHVVLPALAPSERIGPGYYNELDWRVLDSIACIARTLFQQSLKPNMHQSVFGASAPNRSDWDVRTRLATVLGSLELPFRCRFRFDCNIEAATVSAKFDYPPAFVIPHAPDAMQGARGEGVAGGGEPRTARALEAFSLRFACLVAAACFGSGRDIGHVHLAAMDEHWARPLLSCVFERTAFVRSVLSAIDSGRFVDASLRHDPDSFAEMLGAEHLDWASGIHGSPRFGRPIALPDDTMRTMRVSPWEDGRALPDGAASLFRACRVCDIDTSHYLGPHAELIDEAKEDSDDSAMAAIVRLESIVDELEQGMEAPDRHADARPLYCPHALSRLAVVLTNDELSVGAQAESFLDSGAFDTAAEDGFPWFFRAPSALYHAHMGLSDLYQRMGDFPGAQMHADRCIALAPTAPGSYYRKADVLAEQKLPEQAANVLISGLRYASTGADAALLYYYLGLLMWNMGMRRHAAAIHVYNASLQGEFAEKSGRIVAGLRKRGDMPVIVHASPIAAAQEMARLRIPVAPVDMRAHVALATIELSCADAPLAAAPYAAALARCCRNDDVVVAACQSIIHGTSLTS